MDRGVISGFSIAVRINGEIYEKLLVANGLSPERARSLKVAFQRGVLRIPGGGIALSGYDAKRHVLRVFPEAAFYSIGESPAVLGIARFQKLVHEKLLNALAHESKHVIQFSRRYWRILKFFEDWLLPNGLLSFLLGLFLPRGVPKVYHLLSWLLRGLKLTPMTVLALSALVYVSLRFAEKGIPFLWQVANRLAYTLAPSEIQARRFAQKVIAKDSRWRECITVTITESRERREAQD